MITRALQNLGRPCYSQPVVRPDAAGRCGVGRVAFRGSGEGVWTSGRWRGRSGGVSRSWRGSDGEPVAGDGAAVAFLIGGKSGGVVKVG